VAALKIIDPLPFVADGRKYPEGTAIIKMSQPNAAFAKALLELQHYPDMRDASGRPVQPYDVTAHSLSLLMGVEPVFVYKPFRYRLPPERGFGGCDGGGPVEVRVGLYKSHVPSMDKGWTRWVMENGHPFAMTIQDREIEDQEIRTGGLAAKYDTIIIPDQVRAAILNGHRKGTMPDEYTGGLGEQGVNALREFVEAGGTLVCLNRASDFAIEQFKLPVRDVVDGLPRTDFYVPGSILRIEVENSNPVAFGIPKESIAWVENSPVFEVIQTTARAGDQVLAKPTAHAIAWYAKDKDPLLSGWLLGADRVKGKAALVQVEMGKGPHHSVWLSPAISRAITGDLSAVFQCDQLEIAAVRSRWSQYHPRERMDQGIVSQARRSILTRVY
jgi:hypothetical protein